MTDKAKEVFDSSFWTFVLKLITAIFIIGAAYSQIDKRITIVEESLKQKYDKVEILEKLNEIEKNILDKMEKLSYGGSNGKR